jgi:molecular chaperone GrpE
MTEAKDRNEERADATEEQDAAVGVEPGGAEAAPAGDEATGAAGPDAMVDDLRDELQSLNDRHLRLAAEFDNYRKRNERERQTAATRLQANLVSALLDVLDDLQRVAESDAEGTAQSILEGVRLVEKKLVGVLEGAGLEPLDSEGERFDPEVMEALMTVPTDDPDRDEHVADVFQRGYRFRDVLIRPARVRVHRYDPDGSD